MEGGERFMLGPDKTQVWANVPKTLKSRLIALKELDPVLFSESRVTSQCLAAHLPVIEANAKSFPEPMYESPGPRRRRQTRVA